MGSADSSVCGQCMRTGKRRNAVWNGPPGSAKPGRDTKQKILAHPFSLNYLTSRGPAFYGATKCGRVKPGIISMPRAVFAATEFSVSRPRTSSIEEASCTTVTLGTYLRPVYTQSGSVYVGYAHESTHPSAIFNFLAPTCVRKIYDTFC